ncbi:MAG TPA: tetratricopeptide repeat protein [Vicinamibacterales bacterium]|nr:tetratricopeptide repeat protein [Vicinamibacterales bacterium]
MRRAALSILLIVLAGCATSRPAPSATTPVPPNPLPEITRLIERGCYTCLEKAHALAREHAVSQLAFETAAILALRSLELGLPAAAWLSEAQTLADGDAARLEYMEMVAAIPPDPLSGNRDDLLSETRARNRDRTRAPAWRQSLTSGPGSEVFKRYLDIALVCSIDVFRESREELVKEIVDRPVPVLEYRAGICDSRFVTQLSGVRVGDPDFVDADYVLGKYALENRKGQNQEEALRLFRSAAAAFPQSPAIATNVGNLLQAWEDWPQALAAYDTAIALVPTHPDALIGRTVSLSYLERHQEAIDTATRLIDGGRWFLGQAYYWRGWNYYYMDNANAARVEADRARTLMVNAAVFVLSGMIEWRLTRPTTAEKEFEEAIVMDAGQCEAALMLGGVRSDLRKTPEGIAALEQARQCFDLSITVRRRAIGVINDGSGTPETKAREIARHERAIARAESRRADAEKAIATLRKRTR